MLVNVLVRANVGGKFYGLFFNVAELVFDDDFFSVRISEFAVFYNVILVVKTSKTYNVAC